MQLVEEQLTHSVIGGFYAVHRELGFGFLEHVHAAALEYELLQRGHRVSREFDVTIRYAGLDIAHQRLDMLVDDKLVVEIKSTERLHPDAKRQLHNYLRATSLDVGLLLHFGRSARFHRVVCTKKNDAPLRPSRNAGMPPSR
jgi:GxxExxY protein